MEPTDVTEGLAHFYPHHEPKSEAPPAEQPKIQIPVVRMSDRAYVVMPNGQWVKAVQFTGKQIRKARKQLEREQQQQTIQERG